MMTNNALKHGIFRDVLLVPPDNKLTGKVDAGLAHPDKFPDFARHNREGVPCDIPTSRKVSNPKRLQGRYIYGGFALHHFGHMMAESFGRLWLHGVENYNNLPILFVVSDENPVIIPHLEAVLSAVGICDFVIEKEMVVVEELVIGEMGKQLRTGFHPDYVDWLKQHNKARFEDKNFPEKICVLRSHLAAGKLVGEKALEDVFQADGYFVLRPEEYSLVDQFKYFFNARKIVFSEGSAIHMCDLLPPLEADIAVLNRRPLSILAETSLRQKTDRLHIFGEAVRVLSPRSKQNIGYNRALSYAPFAGLRSFLLQHGYVSESGFPEDWATNVVLEDGLAFMEFLRGKTNDGNAVMVAPAVTRDDTSPTACKSGRLLERLMDEVKIHFDLTRDFRFNFQMTRAQAALEAGLYDDAINSAKAALAQFPLSTLAQDLLTEAEKRKVQTTGAWGKIIDRIRLSLRAFNKKSKLLDWETLMQGKGK